MPHGIILAGGNATRLGIIGAQLNKSLVSIGQKPTVVRQIQQLLKLNCAPITVVVSPRTAEQVKEVVVRSGLPAVNIVTQAVANGPGGALRLATQKMHTGSCILLMADTLLSDDDMAQLRTKNTAAVMAAPSRRSWTYWDDVEERWIEGISGSHTVSVGAFHFGDAHHLHEMTQVQMGVEVKMAAVCNAYGDLLKVITPSWQDIGDLEALAEAQRQRFISRGKHKMRLDERGVLVKEGASLSEAFAVHNPPPSAKHLYPTVYDMHGKLGDDSGTYEMEYVDIPSLTEQWLYWPGLPETWAYVTTELVKQMDRYHWQHERVGAPQSRLMLARANRMYVGKLYDRYFGAGVRNKVKPWRSAPAIFVNGKPALGGPPLIEEVTEAMQHFVDTAPDHAAMTIHGDMYFGNVLWSARTGIFKLLDPRGEWGGPGTFGDMRYDIGKIAFSPILAPIGHRLFEVRQDGHDEWALKVWVGRNLETQAVDDALIAAYHGSGTKITREELEVLKVYYCLSSAPLHDEPEASALYLTAVERWASLSR
jgi:CTP:molybdopterin cytidylyltransferase MocA